MNTVDQQSPEARTVRDVAHGRWKAEVLAAVLDLDLPQVLDAQPRSVAELGRAVGADHSGLARLLELAAALGLCTQVNGQYSACRVTELLREDTNGSMRIECLHVLSSWGRIAWSETATAVRTGSSGFRAATGMSVFDYLAVHPDEAATFHAFQAEVTRRNACALIRADLLPSTGCLVDVGGGTGTLLCALLEAGPARTGVVFDRPEVVGQPDVPTMGGRLSWASGHFFTEDGAEELPRDRNVYLLSHVLHDWADTDAATILRLVTGCMAPTSRVVVLENVLRPDRPNLLVSYLNMLMLAAWGSVERTVPEYVGLLDEAGLDLVSDRLLVPATGLTALVAKRR